MDIISNTNPFTERQEKFLKRIHQELVEIRNPDKEILDERDFEFYLEHTKKYGTIPKIKFIPNTLTVKEKIMADIGYIPVASRNTWRERRKQAAHAFNKNWDLLMFRLKKAGIMFARINELFTLEGETLSKPIELIQRSINPEQPVTKIASKDPPEPSNSYVQELEKCKTTIESKNS